MEDSHGTRQYTLTFPYEYDMIPFHAHHNGDDEDDVREMLTLLFAIERNYISGGMRRYQHITMMALT